MAKQNQNQAPGATVEVSEVSEVTSVDVAAEPTPDTPVETSDPEVKADESKAIPVKPRTVEELIKPCADAVKSIALRFVETARRYLNPGNSGRQFFELGELSHEWQEAAFNDAQARGVTYSRKNVSGLIRDVARAADVPDSLNLPHEYSATFWLAQLVSSDPPETMGDPRTWREVNPDEFWRGNMTYAVVRKLFPCIDRASGDSELDAWEFKPGLESWTKETVRQLQSGKLSANAVSDMLKAKTDALKAAEKTSRENGMSAEQLKAARALEKAKTREKRIGEIRSEALTLAQKALEKAEQTPADFRDLLVSCGAIPAEPRVNAATIKGMATVILPGDAKLLVQELASLAMVKKDKRAAESLAALASAIQEIRVQPTATQGATSNPTIPLRKTGS